MKCPECNGVLKKISVSVYGAKQKVMSEQCEKCNYFTFDKLSSEKVIKELRDTPLKIKQKVVKLSQDRLGIYLNTHIVTSLGIKKGEEVFVSVPDKKHIIIELH